MKQGKRVLYEVEAQVLSVVAGRAEVSQAALRAGKAKDGQSRNLDREPNEDGKSF